MVKTGIKRVLGQPLQCVVLKTSPTKMDEKKPRRVT